MMSGGDHLSNIPEAEWKDVIKIHLGKSLCSKYRKIAVDLLLIELGLKCGFLFDYTNVSRETLVNFLEQLQSRKLVQSIRDLKVVQIAADVIICNSRVSTCEHYSWEKFKFVNVSRSKKYPHVLNPDSSGLQKTREAYDKIRTDDLLNCIEISDDTSGINPSTLFGVMIGYPVVYWYEMGDSDHPLLSLEPLHCVQIFCGSHLAYGFSVPLRLWEEVKGTITDWFELRKSEFKSKLSVDLRFEVETKTLPAVCL